MTEQTGNNKPNEAEGLAFPLSGNEKLIEEARATMRRQEWAPAGLLIRLADALEAAEKAHTTTPPDGWFYMGSHVGAPWLNLEFSEEMDETGLPLWERPVQHTPTKDEREALRIAHLDARQAAYRKEREDWFVDHEAEPEIATNAFFRGWDAAVGGGFRRSEVPEPSTDWYDLAVKAFPWDASEGDAVLDARRRMVQVLTDNFPEPCAECPQCHRPDGLHKLGCGERFGSEPQGEPSDAALYAAFKAFRAHERKQEFNEFDELTCSECGYAYTWKAPDGRYVVLPRRRERHIAREALRAAGGVNDAR